MVKEGLNLPHLDSKRWKKLQMYYQSLQNIQDSHALVSILKEINKESQNSSKEFCEIHDEATGFTDVATYSNLSFIGLQIFLDNVLTDSERRTFYAKTLPFIATLASKLDEHAPVEEIFVLCKQTPCSISLNRKFIASVLASGFLCGLSKNTTTAVTRTINFDDFYASLNRPELKDVQAVKLRCILYYFERLASNNLDLSGELIFERKVVNKSSLPCLADWSNCNAKLCPIIVDHHSYLVDSDPSFLQVDFSDCFNCEGLLGNKHGQHELHFCTSPELFVTSLFMESLDSNESLVIKGAERFSSLQSNNGAVWLAREFHDTAERDICGNLQRTIASVALNQDCDHQNKEELVLSLLNKALVCFYNQRTACDLFKVTDVDEMNGYGEEMEINKEDFGGTNDEVDDGNYGDEEETSIMYIDDDITDINANIQIYEIEQFSDSLVSMAFREAEDDIKVNFRVSCIHAEDTREILENLMKKSVHDVFKDSPKKERKYQEDILSSPLTPKCMLQSRDFNYCDSPLVPGTPPSSPQRRSLFTSGNQSPVSCVSSSTPFRSEDMKLGITSFADSLADSLISCVMLSSSLATSIATIASTPLKITSVAMETLRESPVKKGQQILSSFLSPNAKLGETFFGEKEGGFGLLDLSNEVDTGLEFNPYPDENSEEENEARRKSLNELALNLFQDFASKLASSIITSATGFVCENCVLQYIDEERDGGGGGDDDDSDSDDTDERNNSSSNENGSSDFEFDRGDNPDGGHADKENNSKESDNDKCYSTESGSEQDSTEGCWEDLDFDKEFEDRFYELDLTDDEETSNICHRNYVTEMANRMVKDLFNSAYPEIAKERQEKVELHGSEEKISGLEMENESELFDSKYSLLSEELIRTPENGLSMRLFLDYAMDLSTQVLQEALLFNASIKFEQDALYEQSLETYSEAEKVEKDRKDEITYLTEKPNQEDEVNTLSKTKNVKLNEKGFEIVQIKPENVKIDGAPFEPMSASEDSFEEFAHVLSKQLLETSKAIAGASIMLQEESLSVRPIATGCWSFADQPGVEAVIQWIVASAVGCPALVCYTEDDVRLEKFSKIQQILRHRYWEVRDIMSVILRYIQQDESSEISNLYETLLKECKAS